MNVTVENASANASVSVDVSESADPDDGVSFSSVNVTPANDGSFSLNVTASGDAIRGKTPSTALPNGSQPLGYLSVDHSIRDENISEVGFRFRVRADRVNGSEREAISLYRFHGGTWNELPTTLVRTTDSHYVYRVRSPGLSEFAAGKKRPDFEITDAAATDETLSTGDDLRVRVRVANRGGAHGTFTARLVIDGEQVAQHRVSIAADGMRQTTFERELTEPGAYEVYVNDHRVSEVAVDDGATADGDGADGDATTAASAGTESTDEESAERDDDASSPRSTDSVGRDVTESATTYLPNGIAATDRTSALGLGAVTAALVVACVAGRCWRE
ncbi:PGF-pre-PGF domain-containing protein [Halorussus litoreus]|uniref:PGF-pre-PGF domain-containing protein n=1 Tax=Halorussus litoreus TaxID=1710536 RepID=UPI001300AC41|nr:PGF-pre-PGF domain-containing protein [Halorussus litoreus]